MDLTTAPQTNTEIGSESCNTKPFDEGQCSNFTATYSPEDNKLRISSVRRFDDETLERVKAAGFRWAPRQQIWVAPMWTPGREALALELAGEIDDEDKSLAERAADRAERFGDYSSNRAQDAERARSAVAAIAGNIPFGQPILVGHHSERRARKDAEKITNGMRRAVSNWEQADYWQRRAASALAHAKYKELPAVRHRRIKSLESDKRSHERNIAQAEKFIAAWTRDGLTLERAKAIAGYDRISKCFLLAEYPRDLPASQYEGFMSLYSALDGIITAEQAREIAVAAHSKTLEWAGRWVTHYANRIAYERAMLQEAGGLVGENQNIEVGGRVLIGGEWLTVVRLNKKDGRLVSVTTNAKYVRVRGIEEIKQYEAPSAEAAAQVVAAMKKPEICNYAGAGFIAITQAQWDKVSKDYKATRVIAATEQHGAHRARVMLGCYADNTLKDWSQRHAYLFVFMQDAKRKDPPAATPSDTPPPAIEAPERVTSSTRPVLTQEPSAEALDFQAMKDTLKEGIKTVSAPQLFPTPRELAARMVDLANLQIGARVLEPSAGTGRILEALPGVSPFPGMRQTALDVVAVEIMQSLADRLKESGLAGFVKCADFLTCTPEELGSFDACLMNPPFAPSALDIEHIQHALGMLKPGGVLVAICANGPRQNAQLRPIVEASNGTWEVLPADTFKESGTGVNTVLLSMTR